MLTIRDLEELETLDIPSITMMVDASPKAKMDASWLHGIMNARCYPLLNFFFARGLDTVDSRERDSCHMGTAETLRHPDIHCFQRNENERSHEDHG